MARDLEKSEGLWLMYEEVFIVNNVCCEKRKVSLNLYSDQFNLFRSKTRMNNVNDIYFRKSEPVLLRNDSYFTKLIIENIHEDVHHSSIASALKKLCSKFWLVKGRSSVNKVIINRCITCKFLNGKIGLPPSTPQLPKYIVCCEYPFENVGVDYARPLFIRDICFNSKE